MNVNNPLEQYLIKEIKTQGAMPLDCYMDHTLNHPEYGYYITRDPLGKSGDFITAPEISQVFGELLGLWGANIWQQMKQPKQFSLVELGPGRGTLMKDICRAGKILPHYIQSAEIHFVENSPILRKKQQQNIPYALWHSNIHTLPNNPSIIFANEFFDALPIKQYIRTTHGWAERHITYEQEYFTYIDIETIPPHHLPISCALGDMIEICPYATLIVQKLVQHISIYGGALLIIDYGYIKKNTSNSLQAVKNHQCVSPLVEVGSSDLTAHVDFVALQQATKQSDVICHGPVTQRTFLTQLGISQRFDTLKTHCDTPKQHELTMTENRLISPHHMGSLFKVMSLSHSSLNPEGFLNA